MSVKRIKEWPESERPRERLLSAGSDSLSDAQLLAIILRTGGNGKSAIELAMELIKRYENLNGINDASIQEMLRIPGLGKAKIAQIKAAFELGRRLLRESRQKSIYFNSPRDVYEYYATKFKGLKKEVFHCALLDTKNRLIKDVRISEGTLTNSLIHPRESFREAIRESANSVIFVHNHPSGDPLPSADDRKVTEILIETGKIVGINVLDHIIIGDERYYSLINP